MKSVEVSARKEQMEDLGRMIERRVLAGEDVVLPEMERVLLKQKIEAKEVRLATIEGKANLSQQAEGLEKALGEERMRDLVATLTADSLEKKIDWMIAYNFVNEYLWQIRVNKFRFSLSGYEKWQKKAVMRAEAIISGTNKLLWVLAAESEEESKRRQITPGFQKHFRERLLRGAEREGAVIDPEVPRYVPKDPKKGEIRVWPRKMTERVLMELTQG